jgi:hypothetical protein
MNFAYFKCIEISILCSCFYGGQEHEREKKRYLVVVSESKLGAKIHGSEVEAIDLGFEVGATVLDSEIDVKIYGSNFGAKVCGSKVLVTFRMS